MEREPLAKLDEWVSLCGGVLSLLSQAEKYLASGQDMGL